MEAELAMNNGDIGAVWTRLRESDLQISEWHGNSVYAFAGRLVRRHRAGRIRPADRAQRDLQSRRQRGHCGDRQIEEVRGDLPPVNARSLIQAPLPLASVQRQLRGPPRPYLGRTAVFAPFVPLPSLSWACVPSMPGISGIAFAPAWLPASSTCIPPI